MATNPLTGIDPETDRFAQVDTDAQTTGLSDLAGLRNLNVSWPRDDGAPITSSSGTFRFRYFKMQSDAPPVAGPQYVVQGSAVLAPADPAPPTGGYPAGIYGMQYELVARTAEEQKAQVDSQRKTVIRLMFPQAQEPEWNIKVAEAVRAQSAGDTLSAGQSALLADVTALSSAVSECDSRRDALYAAIDAAEPYDLCDGWPVTCEQIESALSGGI